MTVKRCLPGGSVVLIVEQKWRGLCVVLASAPDEQGGERDGEQIVIHGLLTPWITLQRSSRSSMGEVPWSSG